MTPAGSLKLRQPATGRIRPLGPGERGLLLDLFKAAVPPAWLERSIYTAPGAERFLAADDAYPALMNEERFWVFEGEDGTPAAAAHFRRTEEGSHLNYVAVLQAHRSSGIASQMMSAWEAYAREQGAQRLTLDVLEDNLQALRLYERLGFQEQHWTHEHRLLGSPPKAPIHGVHLEGWAQAQSMFECYGFGRFALSIGDERVAVDLRGQEFRLGSPRPEFLAALAYMDPGRAIVLKSAEVPDLRVWAPIGVSIRMAKAL